MYHRSGTNSFHILFLPLALALLLLVAPVSHISARSAVSIQSTANRERLLNGLSFFIIPQPSSSEVSLFLRIHSGAGFDLAGKEGTMALLARSLFPDDNTRTYIEEELGGRMNVTTDYDAINIHLSGRAGSVETLVELLRNAVVPNTTVDVATLNSLRSRYLADLETGQRAGSSNKSSASPIASLADRAIAQRLFGAYPLGRMATGTPESLARVERPDLIFARSRFLTPDNATLVILGAVDPNRVRPVLRQYLGAWRKSDSRAQATFRQPSAPNQSLLLVPVPASEQVEIRIASRAPARTDRDYTTALLLASVLRARLQMAMTSAILSEAKRFDVRYNSFKLAGALTISATIQPADVAATFANLRSALSLLASTNPLTSIEIEQARLELLANNSSTDAAAIASPYLDADTYGAKAIGFTAGLRAVTPADVQRLASKLFVPTNMAFVAAGDRAKLETELAKSGISVEVLGTNTTAEAMPVRAPIRTNQVPVTPLTPTPAAPAAKRP